MARYLVIFLIIAVICQRPVEAGANEVENSPENISIVVLMFQANNCPPSFARALTDMLGGELFKSGLFALFEKSRVDVLTRGQGLPVYGCNDTECAVQIGKLLSVQKVVIGSISRLRKYRIEVRVVNVSDGAVDILVNVNVNDEEEFEESIETIIQRIEHFFLGYSEISGKFDISITAASLFAVGKFTEGARAGFGVNAYLTLNRLLDLKMKFILNMGIYSFIPKLKSIKSLLMLPVEFHAAYPFSLQRNIKFMPSVGFGYIFSRMRYDRVEYRTSGEYEYTTGYYYNPLCTLRSEFNLLLFHRWFLVLTQKYTVFFESARVGQIFSADFGIKMLF